MSNGSPEEGQPALLSLTARQREVWLALKNRETATYPLSDWYVGALCVLADSHNPDRFSQAAQSLRELVEKLPKVVSTTSEVQTSDFKGLRRRLRDRLLKDKDTYPEGWEGRVIDSHLSGTLREINKYFELNQQPTRKDQIQRAVAIIDPLVDRFDKRVQQRKSNDLHRLLRRLEDFAHHTRSSHNFGEVLKDLESLLFDLLAPITAQDQKEINSIIRLHDRAEIDVERLLSLIGRRGSNYALFFNQITDGNDASWVSILRERGYFDSPPGVEPAGEGGVRFPFWLPIRYLAKMSVHEPGDVLDIVLGLPETDNPFVYSEILEIALQLRGDQSGSLLPKILEYARLKYEFGQHRYGNLLAHWAEEEQTSAALELLEVLGSF